MSKFKIDSKQKELFKAVGLNDKDVEALAEKQATIAVEILTGDLLVMGAIAEKIASCYSYSELLASATKELVDKTFATIKRNPDALSKVIISEFDNTKES